MATTLGDVRDEVVQDILGRTDDKRYHGLKAARDAYLSICGKIPFPELQAVSDPISVTAGQNYVDISALSVAGIISLRYYDSSADTYRKLEPTTAAVFDDIPTRRAGVPATFARGAGGVNIEFDSVIDDSADTITLRYWRMPAITDPNDNDELTAHVVLLPMDWIQLLRWEALYTLYHYSDDMDQIQKAMMLVTRGQYPRMGSTNKIHSHEMGIIPRLWNDLLQTLAAREGPYMEYALAPLIRRYTKGA
jgi:hypothetical protein